MRLSIRLIALLFTVALIGPPVAAQTVTPSPPPSAPPSALSSDADAKAAADARAADPDLPVSLGKIRDALERAAAPGLLKNVQDAPTFRIEIRERQKIDELLGTLDFKAGPTPPGGVYAYEQQRVMFPPVDNPMAQPYAAFDQTQLAIVAAQSAVSSMVAKYVAKGLKDAYRAQQLQAARADVDRAIAEYCAGKENGGAGIQICEPSASTAR
ncbi:MAG: hypothetical protein ABI868_03265 [Acidobacteriota bacterium]